MWISFLLLSCVASVGLAAVGQCPSPKTKAEFDLEKFAGTWYVVEASAGVDKITKKCSSYVVEKTENYKASLLHKYVFTVTGKYKSEFSEMTTPKKDEPAKFLVSPLKGTILARKWPLWVIDTDYNEYAILFACHKLLLTHTEEVFIVSRKKSLDDKKMIEIYNSLKKADINQKNLVKIDQDAKECTE